MKFSQNPFIASTVSVCYVLIFGPVLLTLCDTNELLAEYNNENTESEEHDQKNDASDQLSTNQFSTDEPEFNSPNNVNSHFSINENRSKSESNDSDTDYDYDYDASHYIFNWSELIPTLVVYGATMVIGIAGNSLIIFTICRYRRMKSTTNVFLASLASADLLLIIICIPVKVRGRHFLCYMQYNESWLCGHEGLNCLFMPNNDTSVLM